MTQRDDEHLAGERSPLVTPDPTDTDGANSLTATGDQEDFHNVIHAELAESKSSWYLFLLTLSIGG